MPRKRNFQGVLLTGSAAADQILYDLCKSCNVNYRALTNQAKSRFIAVFENFSKNCIYCGRNEDNVEKYGEIIHSRCGISVHYFCLLFSSGLVQTETDERCNVADTTSAIYGFSIKSIVLEFARGAKLRCSYCRKPGASVGCACLKCPRKFHYPCGVERQHLFQYFGTFQAFCQNHRPVQQIPKSIIRQPQVCGICFDHIDHNICFDVLTTPCCKNSRLHRKCVEKQALSFGMYLFRCPLCNNSDDYANEMKQVGVYIPQRDASWETPDAYADLLESRLMCDMEICCCEYGRKYDQTGTVWSIIGCVICSSTATHAACGSLKLTDCAFVCDICKSVWGVQNIGKKLKDMGFNKTETMVKLYAQQKNDHIDVVKDIAVTPTPAVIENPECGGDVTTRRLRPRVIYRYQCYKRKRQGRKRMKDIAESQQLDAS